MEIKGTKTEVVQIEVSNSDIINAFLKVLRRKLPLKLYLIDVRIDVDGRLYYVEEVIGHNRDFERKYVDVEYPEIKITDEELSYIRLITEINSIVSKL